jgi:hypothetical protein
MHLKSVLAVFVVTCSLPLIAQTVPDANAGGFPQWRAGAGISITNPDFGGHGDLYGGTLWVEYVLNKIPESLRGTSVELEARDLRFGVQRSESVNQYDSAAVGPTYTFRRKSMLRPYVKFNFGMGNADYRDGLLRLHHSGALIGFGGGATVKAYRQLWVRFDYEYQVLPTYFKSATGSAALDPQGITVGAMYHLGREAH